MIKEEDTARQIVRFVASEKVAEPSYNNIDVRALDDLVVEPALLSLVCRGFNDRRHARRERGGLDRIDPELLASTGTGLVDAHYDTCLHDQPERVHRFILTTGRHAS